eukprot:UN31185
MNTPISQSKKQQQQTSRKSALQSPDGNDNTQYVNNGKKFWKLMAPIFEFIKVDDLKDILALEERLDSVLYDIPTLGSAITSDPEDEVETDLRECFAEHTEQNGEKYTPCCPKCSQELTFKLTPRRWSCDAYNHFGQNDFAQGESVYCCDETVKACDIAICLPCYRQLCGQRSSTKEPPNWRMFRKNAVTSRLLSAFVHPKAESWKFNNDEGEKSEASEKPTTNIPILNTSDMKKRCATMSERQNEEELQCKYTIEERVRMELRELDLWDDETENLQPNQRQDDECCVFMREQQIILQNLIKKTEDFNEKISKRT